MRRTPLYTTAAALLVAACAPAAPASAPAPVGLPPIPAAEGALEIRVVHPTPTTPRPGVDSTYIYGSVGTGEAALSINGVPVPVAPNGAFLAYLPVPASGSYELVAENGGRSATATRSYRAPSAGGAAPAAPVTEDFPAPRSASVTGGADTLATGSDVAVARPTPGGTYRWFLPRGARVAVTGRRGDQYRLQLDTATAWISAGDVTLADSPPAPGPAGPPPIAEAAVLPPQPGWVDLRFGAERAPFLVRSGDNGLEVVIYGRSAPPGGTRATADPLIAGIEWEQAGPQSARAIVRLSRPVWGYKAFYSEGGDLVLRVRRTPRIDPATPLRGIRVAIDPGHPPGGATGPTGLTEAEANLAIALPLAERLRARGAEVLLTRTANLPVSISDRVEMATDWNADLLVSVHNNAFAEGVNPFVSHGTSVYYFHPFAADLARSLDRAIVMATRVPDLGARVSNLALARPTWMPAALTESLFMLIPQHEAALRDPVFLDRLAAAHVEGIEEFLRSMAAGG